MKRKIALMSIFALLLQGFTFLPAAAQVRPVYDMGPIGLGQQLKRLQTTARALHTGAHPDDEDSGLMAYLARHDYAKTAYLSLTRGEGGQNIIGPELFESLGIIRAEELLQARRLDGGDQFFTRFMEYGFSKKREEAARIWNEQAVLGDMVRTIRLYRPLVLLSRFSGTPADGHGQHQLAGYLTPIAFKAAADPNQFPEHLQEGLRPWQAKKLYVGQLLFQNDPTPASLVLNTGDYDEVIGRTYTEIAMQGLSQHKSQSAGSVEVRGEQTSGVRLLETFGEKVAKEQSVFDGLDTSIRGIAKLTNDPNGNLAKKLDELQNIAESAAQKYEIYAPRKIVPVLAQGLRVAREAENTTRNPETQFFLKQKEKEFADALQMASGVVVDALTDSETIVPGDSTTVAVRVFVPRGADVKLGGTSLNVPQGWASNRAPKPSAPTTPNFRQRPENGLGAYFFNVTAAGNAKPTQPYWLENARKNYTFDWSAAGMDKNMPYESPLVTADVKLTIGGVEVTVNQPIQYRYADEIRGELRRNLNVVPRVTTSIDSTLLIVPVSAKAQSQRVVLSVTNNAPRETKGTMKLNLPSGWTASPASADFALKGRGEKAAVPFEITIPANTKSDSYQIMANATVDGKTYDQSMIEIAYPHIQTHRRFVPAEISAKVLDLKVAPVKVGYIMGTGDQVPAAIKRLGLDVTMLGEADLSTGDLSRFDTIVVGIRASAVRPDFVANNARLLDFVKNGGTLIVQYQQQEYIRENMLPFPARQESVVNGVQRISNVRVVDENAPVKILVPNHPVFNYPNKIVSSDWDNWIQERNLYTLTNLDTQYVPLLESHDEGEGELNGGLVYAKLGKGNYVYNAYSFFRQLPTGNPGAYRLFANLLSLPKAQSSANR
jgi:LmbE family N-acetylglucosaminyl deacetylase